MDAKLVIAIVIGTLFFLMFAGFMLSPSSSSNSRSNSGSYGSYGYRSRSCSSGCMKGGSGGKLLLFHTTWCGYCQQFLPTWEKMAQQHGKVMQDLVCDDGNTENQNKASQYGVKGFPTIVYVDGQGEKDVFSGDRSEENLTAFMKQKGLI